MQVLEESSNNSFFAKKLLDSRELILSLFVQNVRKKMPSAKLVEDAVLENSVFEFLTTIAQFISLEIDPDDWHLFEENIQTSREHGISRSIIPTYTLDQVITEFRILRSIIIFVLEKDGPLPIL